METREFGELEFIGCDLHPLVTAVVMDVKDNGAVQFKCRACDIAYSASTSVNPSILIGGSTLELDGQQQYSIE